MSLSCCAGNNHYGLTWQEFPKCRKPFNCEECGIPVSSGDEYSRLTILYDGFWDHIKVCEKCIDLGDSMAAMGFCWSLGELKEARAEYLREYAPPKLGVNK